jgi:hypothetical protein
MTPCDSLPDRGKYRSAGIRKAPYHRRRRQRGLGRLTPIEYETINQAAHAA